MLVDFNIKEKLKELIRERKKLPKIWFDVGVAFWMLNPDEDDYSPENLCKKYLQEEYPSTSSERVLANSKLVEFAKEKLKEYGMEKLFYEVEMPLVEVLARMELSGIKIDKSRLEELNKKLSYELEILVKKIYNRAGEVFNINSPKQLAAVLFERLGLKPQGISRKGKSGSFSTGVETLLALKEQHPIAQEILDYRELFKMQSTYAEPFLNMLDKKNRLHTTYMQTGTSTGRLSSKDPNLQNIPSTSSGQVPSSSGAGVSDNNSVVDNIDWALEFRKTFVSEKGFKFISFDYSQIELRVLASLSGDPKMIEAFNLDLDIHKITAANVFNVSLNEVTPNMRRLAKTLNFGVVYGMGALAFAATSGLSSLQARKFIEEYFNDFKNIKEWQEIIKQGARTKGFVTNLNGRRRWLLKAVSMFRGEAAEAERAAINMPIQGLAADIIKMAMIEIEKKVLKDQKKIRLLLTIHDELLFEVSEDIIKEAVDQIQKIMEGVYELEVPIKVNIKTGENLGEMK